MAVSDSDISEVDDFLAQEKRLQKLDGNGLPLWGQSHWNDEISANWNIEDALGVVLARLQFRCGKAYPVFPSVSVIFRKNPIWRVDIEQPHVRHPNPPWAKNLGLPAIVKGSHEHNWPDNREYVRRATEWTIPARRPIEPQIRKLSQAVPWLAERINLRFESDQRGFDVPPQAELGLFG